ncbi:Gag-pro-like protein [Gossypium australe]|uniref:Gag-pro-like protein n=1 Tax=Gossypium australe TaxID=47621 RepID=A0A5B6WID8_9ROSI|nr:Gag-pro-like protein [Gossypium australe]
MQEQLAKIQQDMRDQMQESQRSMISQLTQLLAGGLEKRKSTVVTSGDDNEDPTYPLGFTSAGTSAPTNYPTGSSSNLGDNPTNPVVPNLDDMAEMEKEKADYHCEIDAKDLSLVLDLVLPPEFKTPEFEKYNGTSYPEAHITMFCRMMTRYQPNVQQTEPCQINSWKDLGQTFMKQYSHVTDMTPDRITLQNMEKKQSESFRQYAQR